MRVKPGSTHDLYEEWGSTGETLGVRLINNDDGTTTVARTTGFVETPTGSGGYRLKDFTFPDDSGDYTLVFDDDDGTAAPAHMASRPVVVTSSAPDADYDGTTYVTADELYPILKIRGTPTELQSTKASRVLLVAAGEINRELDLAADQSLNAFGVATAAQINLARAAELWKEEEVQFGILGIDSDVGTTYITRDTWDKYAIKLSTLKGQWGLA